MSDIERKLASVRRIAAIDPIEGADQIICVTVDGWKLVSNKENGFKPGDLVIYFEIDSFLPIREEFEWMRDRCYKNVQGLGEGFRVKTIKLRGQVSQGIIVPLSDFCVKGDDGEYVITVIYPDGDIYIGKMYEGLDLTKQLGVRKYEKPEMNGPGMRIGSSRGNFPSFIPKTDQERVQNCLGGIKKWIRFAKPLVEEITNPDLISDIEALWEDPIFHEKLKARNTSFFKSGDMWFQKTEVANSPEVISERNNFEATLKLDGSSITVYHNDGQLGVCSRNNDLKRDTTSAFWSAAIKTGLLAAMAQDGRNLAFQGELMGPGIQGNRENLTGVTMYLYDIYDIDERRYLTSSERYEMLQTDWFDECDLDHVPVLVAELAFPEDMDVDYFLQLADNTKSINNPIAEGIVFKSNLPQGPTFKVISNRFLLKEKD